MRVSCRRQKHPRTLTNQGQPLDLPLHWPFSHIRCVWQLLHLLDVCLQVSPPGASWLTSKPGSPPGAAHQSRRPLMFEAGFIIQLIMSISVSIFPFHLSQEVAESEPSASSSGISSDQWSRRDLILINVLVIVLVHRSSDESSLQVCSVFFFVSPWVFAVEHISLWNPIQQLSETLSTSTEPPSPVTNHFKMSKQLSSEQTQSVHPSFSFFL